ncbi:MAG: hypothetical protein WDW36_002703 [Sanguina aurantia]
MGASSLIHVPGRAPSTKDTLRPLASGFQQEASTRSSETCSSSSSTSSSRCSSPSPEDASPPPDGITLDKSQAIVFKVGLLGDHYWRWVHEADPGHPRFFAPDWAEALTKTPWWIVPLIWAPLFSLCTYLACRSLQPQETTSLMLVGVAGWQLLEYLIHRFLFHHTSTSYWGITLHFLFHGCHHKYPNDKLRLVFPPLPASLLVGLVYLCLNAVLSAPKALAAFSGAGFAYVAYDCLHYAMHNGRWLPAGPLRDLRTQHVRHHKEHTHGYGISSSFFDFMFNTSSKSLLHQVGWA